ncbi:MAG: hypothetical protein ABF297_18320 [Thiogranum sp.]
MGECAGDGLQARLTDEGVAGGAGLFLIFDKRRQGEHLYRPHNR